jgi:hypothetical protein
VTKRERERVRRHAAVIVASALWQRSAPRPVEDAGDDRWSVGCYIGAVMTPRAKPNQGSSLGS